MNNRQADFSAVPPANSRKGKKAQSTYISPLLLNIDAKQHQPSKYIAPWQHHREPDHGVEDPWNHSPDARMHPELHNSAYGTVTTEDEKKEEQEHHRTPTTKTSNDDHHQKEKKKFHDNTHHHEGSSPTTAGCFGHTVESKRSPQAFVKRDLNNI